LKWLLYIFILLFLSDNILWTANLLRGKNDTEWEGHITKDTRQVLDYLKSNATNKDLLVGNASLVNYLSHVYTPASAWVSHPYNTPHWDQRSLQTKIFFESGIKPPEWNDRKILVILDKRKELIYITPSLLVNKLFSNDSYIVFTP
jgi:hypothetical protein